MKTLEGHETRLRPPPPDPMKNKVAFIDEGDEGFIAFIDEGDEGFIRGGDTLGPCLDLGPWSMLTSTLLILTLGQY